MKQLIPHLSGKKHVIWDWNGTLIDDVQTSLEAVSKILKRKNLPVLDIETYRDVFGFPIAAYYERIGLETGSDQMKLLSEEFHKNYDASYDLCSLHDGVVETLREVKRLGHCQSILSAANQDWLMPQLSHFEIREYFDHVFGLTDFFAVSKIDRGRQLLELARIQKSETILIGDTDHDVEVARELGIDVVIFADGHQSQKQFAGLDVPIFSRKIT